VFIAPSRQNPKNRNAFIKLSIKKGPKIGWLAFIFDPFLGETYHEKYV